MSTINSGAGPGAPNQRIAMNVSTASSLLPPNLRSSINNALVANNAIPTIQATLLHECQASGFVSALRTRVLELLRSGECNSYGEVMATVMTELKANGETNGRGGFTSLDGGPGADDGVDGVNGDGGTRRLSVPKRVVEEGVRVVRAALEGCVDIVGDE